MMHNPTEYDHLYFPGFKNRMVRYYFYLNQGLGIVNNFRNLFLGIIAAYIALKFNDFTWLFILFIPAVVALTIFGYYTVHHINKVNDWLGTRFGSHYGLETFNYQQEIHAELKKIREHLEK